MQKQNATFRVNEKMWDDFNKACQENGKSRGKVLRKFMENYINKEGKTNKEWSIIFEYETEKQLQKFLINNFDKYFNFKYIGEEIVLPKIGRVDILGENNNNYIIIELKRNYIGQSALKQAKKYLKLLPSNKYKVILSAPIIKIKSFNYKNIKTKKIKNVKCKVSNQYHYGRKRKGEAKTIYIHKDTEKDFKLLEKEAKKRNRSVNYMINLTIQEFVKNNINKGADD